jgi:hypothetical protein
MGRGSKPQEYYLYFEDFGPKPDKEFGRKPKFCHGLKKGGGPTRPLRDRHSLFRTGYFFE